MLVDMAEFECGEVYLFHPTDLCCNAETSLWGLYGESTSDGSVVLEAASRDLRQFRLWVCLPSAYRFCRQATRVELRDFAFCFRR